MSDRRYVPFNFGFLNTAQDATDIGDNEASVATNLDPDQLALGSLKHEDYSALGDTAKDYLETTLGGRRFFLGTASDFRYSTSYDGSTYSTGSDLFIGGDVTIASRFQFDVTTDQYVWGTGTSTGTDTYTIAFFVSGGELFMRYDDGFSGVVNTSALVTVATATWYDVVAVFDRTNTELRVFLNGSEVYYTTTITPLSLSTSYALDIGGNGTDNSLDGSIARISVYEGVSEEPTKWNGTVSSLKFKNNSYAPVFSTQDGSGVLNDQGWSFAVTGTLSISSDAAKAVGQLNYEAKSTSREYQTVAYTRYRNKSPFTQDAGYTTNDIATATDTVLCFDFTTALTGGIYTLFQGDSTSSYEVQHDKTTDELRVRVQYADNSWSTTEAVATDVSNRRIKLVLHFYKLSDSYGSPYRCGVYVNGTLEHGFISTQDHKIASGEQFAICGNDTGLTGIDPERTMQLFSYLCGVRPAPDEALRWTVPQTWDGSVDFFGEDLNVLISSPTGEIVNNDQGLQITTGLTSGTLNASTTQSTNYIETDLVNAEVRPPKPVLGAVTAEDTLTVTESNAPAGGETFFGDGNSYDGPKELTIVVITISAVGTRWKYLNGTTSYSYPAGTLPHGLRFDVGSLTGPLPLTGQTWEIKVTANVELLDGDYIYRLVAVRESDLDPKVVLESLPSDPVTINLANVAADGQAKAHRVPNVTIPGIVPGNNDFIDRYDLYRKDPDSDDFVKVYEYKGESETVFEDNTPIGNLPRIQFLKVKDDESFSTINEAIGNGSETFQKVFNKDGRLFLVPTDRQDLLLYSRENDWWGWRRENSFSFNGDITEVALVRDPTVVSGVSTLVVFTTKGIYHITGSGTESDPYTRLPVIGGDDFTNIDTFPSSVVPANGAVMLASRSSDGGYDTGAYGQKIYEYDLQGLTEVSGRVRESIPVGSPLRSTLVGGDKYVHRLTANTGLVYHRDARGWLNFDDTAASWTWTSKTWDTSVRQQNTLMMAKQFKLDFKGDVDLTFYVKPYGQDTFQSYTAELNSVSRTTITNMMPANMGEKWYFTLTGTTDTDEVYGLWFVQ